MPIHGCPNCAPSAPEDQALIAELVESPDFYEVMVAYRCAPAANYSAVVHAFEDVKRWLRDRLAP